MQSSNLIDIQEDATNQPKVKRGFWRRQFSSDFTTPQLIFDVALGILLPILCFIFDPIVFNSGSNHITGMIPLSHYKILVYILSAFSILTLALWLSLGKRFGSLSGVIAGILLSGSICSFITGLIILPLSLLSLLVIIELLGFTPFFTSFVYLRNSIRSFHVAETRMNQPRLVGAMLLGAAFAVGVPSYTHWKINRVAAQSINELLNNDARFNESAVRRLKYIGWATDLDQIVWAYARETDQSRKNNLAKAYKEITGNDIGNRLAMLND